MFTIVFWVVGKGYISSDVIVKTMSRTGKASELSMGPVTYGVIMTLVTYFFWKQLDAVFIIDGVIWRWVCSLDWFHPKW